jgi:EAL domain-containing protein (putative c-di-GMP-specific phosphodiesterase class I)
VEANLSAESISNLDLLSVVERELRDADADPSNLVIEITETALMEDIDAGEAFARGLSAIGCGVALDDFGTGFGSFTYLKQLPITYLKIDIDFVRDLVANRASQHLVGAIVGLAKDFGYKTIAEGVENAGTLALLEEYGVDFVQGYHLGRPAEMAAGGA